MIRTNSRSHAAILERYRIALDKAESNPAIAQAMKKIGYGPEKIKEGQELLEATRKIFDLNLQKKDALTSVRDEFKRQKAALDSTFREHRRRALLIFRNEAFEKDVLGVSGPYPRQFFEWMQTMEKFYKEILTKPELQERFRHLNFSKEEAEKGLKAVSDLHRLLAESKLAKGESQDSTEMKDEAFGKLNDWMSDFYGAARLILRKDPQLLEILYKSA